MIVPVPLDSLAGALDLEQLLDSGAEALLEAPSTLADHPDSFPPGIAGLVDWLQATDHLLPQEERAASPRDGSVNYKHYLYGHPKVPT